jgi:cyclopropane-fatty-acyl-phospholipid synthase
MATVSAIGLVEQGLVPDGVSRAGIRRLLKERIRELDTHNCESVMRRKREFITGMNRSPVAAGKGE